MTTELYQGDLPAGFNPGNSVAVDTETMGLKRDRDRLCLVQLSSGDGNAHIVRFGKGGGDAPNLKAVMEDPGILKIFHYARFDVAVMKAYLGVDCRPVYCTRTASRLCRTYTDKHSLRELCRELINVDIDKQQQSSDWGSDALSAAQLKYAASDVLYLHRLKEKLDVMLQREGRMELARACFDFLPVRAELDIAGWQDEDIFAH